MHPISLRARFTTNICLALSPSVPHTHTLVYIMTIHVYTHTGAHCLPRRTHTNAESTRAPPVSLTSLHCVSLLQHNNTDNIEGHHASPLFPPFSSSHLVSVLFQHQWGQPLSPPRMNFTEIRIKLKYLECKLLCISTPQVIESALGNLL